MPLRDEVKSDWVNNEIKITEQRNKGNETVQQ